MELADILRGVSAWLNRIHFDYRNDFLTSLALEVLNRKAETDFFVSIQLIMPPSAWPAVFRYDALLQAFLYTAGLYLEEIFSAYLKLHRMLYNENNGIYERNPGLLVITLLMLVQISFEQYLLFFNKYEQTNTKQDSDVY